MIIIITLQTFCTKILKSYTEVGARGGGGEKKEGGEGSKPSMPLGIALNIKYVAIITKLLSA